MTPLEITNVMYFYLSMTKLKKNYLDKYGKYKII